MEAALPLTHNIRTIEMVNEERIVNAFLFHDSFSVGLRHVGVCSTHKNLTGPHLAANTRS